VSLPEDSLTNQIAVSQFTHWSTCVLDDLQTSQFADSKFLKIIQNQV